MIRQRAVSALYSANRPHIGTAAVRHKKRGVNRPVLPVNTSAIQIEFKQQPSELTRNSSKCTFEFRAEILSLSRKSLYYCRLSLFSPCSTVYISILCPYFYFSSRSIVSVNPGRSPTKISAMRPSGSTMIFVGKALMP
nr:MAG TPA: hypothetical protein [Caudoviricetes sp.]